MVRGRDACWEHCVLVDATRQKVRCNYCQREFSGGVYRMKFHLAQIKNKDIVPCTEVPSKVRDLIHSILKTPKKQKNPKKRRIHQVAQSPEHSSSASGSHGQNANSSAQHGSTCPSSLFPQPSSNPQPTIDNSNKQKHAEADRKIALFFFHNSIPFRASKSTCYHEMVEAVAECGIGYKPPSYDQIRSSLLEKAKLDMNESHRKLKDSWKDTGCTIISDSWTDGNTLSLIVFSVSSPKGILFLKCVDASAHADDAHYLFELLESIVLEVGAENVVQIITDSAACYVYAGRLLTSKYPSLFWSPCASNSINKMLEDISKQEWVNTVLEEASIITRYIYSHPWVLSLMKKFTGSKELIRPCISQFSSPFLSLRSILVQENNLKKMFSHSDWISSVYSKRQDGQAVRTLVYLDRFWRAAHEVINLSEPLVKVLRIVDGDMSCMGYVYDGIERAKLIIKSYCKGIEERYMPIWDIIDCRWNMHQHSPLYGAAAFVNPSIFYNYKIDSKVQKSFYDAMARLVPDDRKAELAKETPMYVNAHGALGNDFAIMGRTLNAPGDWWACYGYEVPTFQNAAIRILSQPCSSNYFLWNWNIFQSMHTKKRSKFEQDKLGDLVFVHCNLRLQSMYNSRDAKRKSIVFDEVDVSSTWPKESEFSQALLDDSWLESLPFDCRGSPSI